jgi:hypothetical protein
VPQVIAVKFDQVEGVKEDAPVIAPVAQPVEHRQAIPITGNRLAVDQARRSLERERGARDQWEAAGPVVSVAGENRSICMCSPYRLHRFPPENACVALYGWRSGGDSNSRGRLTGSDLRLASQLTSVPFDNDKSAGLLRQTGAFRLLRWERASLAPAAILADSHAEPAIADADKHRPFARLA